MSSGVSKVAAERHQRILLELVAQPGNDVCADCKSKNPRWASHNLGIFLCVHCAAIHRKMGTHISKVKSLTLDTWTKEQVEHMKNTGNVKSNSVYNPDETRNPLPANMMEAERDSEIEKYIRAKYEFQRFKTRPAQIAEKPRAPQRPVTPVSSRGARIAEQLLGPSRSAAAVPPVRSRTSPSPSRLTAGTSALSPSPNTTASRPLMSGTYPAPSAPSTQPQTQPQASPDKSFSNPVWDDLVSLQAPSTNSTLPLQIVSPQTTSALPQQGLGSMNGVGAMYGNIASNPTGFNSLGPNPAGFNPSPPYGNMTGATGSGLGFSGMSGSMPSFASGMTGGSHFQQNLQPPSSFMGPSSSPSFSPMNGMQSNPFAQQQHTGMPFSPQPPAGFGSYPQQQFQPQPHMSAMMAGAPAPFQPQPQTFSSMPQQFGTSPQAPFATTPSPIPMAGMGQQFQQPGWNAGQPGYAGGAGGQWGTM
ncbi:ArfGap-domain-containing protein [Heliocybe sulcata]|uniref:ArfGap-domain-containing protein n=1 Tax=Heliocybe sulcata TaxID=5364 RepID=A0A5C3NB16_9AGAM|nr:ArfGap-domain-containing protein [Heliocybe sulcata]